MFERILYAAELSEAVPRSLTYVQEIALNHDSEVIVMRVGEVDEGQLALAKKHDPDIEGAREGAEIRQRVQGRVSAEDVAQRLRDAGVFVRTEARAGRVAEEVLKAAEDLNVQLVIIGSAPRTALGALLTGNVTDEIVRRARRPVLVIPQQEPHPPEDQGT